MTDGSTITESGGPTMGAGASYQGWVSAQYLAQLLSVANDHASVVVGVRVESREEVDDVEVQYSLGSRTLVQAKRRLELGSSAWNSFWRDALTTEATEIVLAVGGDDGRWDPLITVLVRSRHATELRDAQAAWAAGRSADVVHKIRAALPPETTDEALWQVLRRSSVVVGEVESIRERCASLLPASSVSSEVLGGLLAELATRGFGVRRHFTAPELRRDLRDQYSIEFDPSGAGLSAYLSRVEAELNRMAIDGYVAATIEQAFIWPSLRRPPLERNVDRFSEIPHILGEPGAEARELLDGTGGRTVVVAGAGLGKSSLLRALGRRAITQGRVPVYVSLPVYSSRSDSRRGLLEFVRDDRPGLEIPWRSLAARGDLVLLFDGLDEVESSRRPAVLTDLHRFSAAYPLVPWVVAARDPAAGTVAVDAEELWVAPFDDARIRSLLSYYDCDDRLWRALEARPALLKMCAIPLLAALLAGSVRERGFSNLPQGPFQLLNDYVEFLLDPSRVREGVELGFTPTQLRESAAALAAGVITAGATVVTRATARATLASNTDAILANLVRSGLLRKTRGNYQFAVPTLQEFLAGEHLAATRSQEIPNLISNPARPWAQAVQFALAQVSEPDVVARQILEADDDAFRSNLRAVARAIVWGASVSTNLRARVAEELASFWRAERLPYELDRELEELLLAGFSTPLPPPIVSWLRERGVRYGSADRFCALASKEVVLAALRVSLPTADDPWFLVRDLLLPRLREILLPVVDLLVEHVDSQHIGEKAWWGVVGFAHALLLDSGELPPEVSARVPASLEEANGEGERMLFVATNTDANADMLEEYSLRDDLVGSKASDLLFTLGDRRERWMRLVLSDATPTKVRHRLLGLALNDAGDEGLRWLRTIVDEGTRWISLEALTNLAMGGDEVAFDELTERVDFTNLEEASLWGGSLAAHDGDPVLPGLKRLEAAEFRGEKLRRLVRALAFPVKYEADGFFGLYMGLGGRPRVEPHIGQPLLLQLARDSAGQSLTATLERLKALTDAVSLGADDLRDALAAEIESAWRREPRDFWQSVDGQGILSHALHELPPGHLSSGFAEELVVEASWNEASSALPHLGAESMQLEDLLSLHEQRAFEDNLLLGVIRRAAVRRGVRIVRRAGALVSEDLKASREDSRSD